MKKMYWCVLAGFLMSCTIEMSQLLTQRGYMQIDDVLTNTAGAMAGWLIWKIRHASDRLFEVRIHLNKP